jgi:hypothetical protein
MCEAGLKIGLGKLDGSPGALVQGIDTGGLSGTAGAAVHTVGIASLPRYTATRLTGYGSLKHSPIRCHRGPTGRHRVVWSPWSLRVP